MTRNIPRNGLDEAIREKSQFAASPNVIVPRSHNKPPSIIPFQEQEWNTKSLPWRITSDVTAAACASGCVAPVITIIDRAIIEKAANRSTLRASMLSSFSSLLTRPHRFLTSKPALLISALYFGTYATANTVDTISSTISNTPSSKTTSGPAKFLATTSINLSLCLYKDSQFAKMFGPPPGIGVAAKSIPIASYALFTLRDSLTIFASFNLPPSIAPLLPISQEVEKQMSRASIAQFVAPAGIQLLSTPLHLWGLDLYNRPMGREGVGWRERVRRVRRDWLGSSAARMGRIVPAFGVGGVVNAGVRRKLLRE